MRGLLKLTVRSVLGALLGGSATMLGNVIDPAEGFATPLLVLPTIGTALVGLTRGASAATYSYLAATAVALTVTAVAGPSTQPLVEAVRLATFLGGVPLLIVLVHRADLARATAQAAFEASSAAETRAAHERSLLEAARRRLNHALREAERDRARLEEVAESIPEPLIVYDDAGRGTYGNRAALRLFGRSFIERPLDQWGRSTEPRDERGTPLDREDWPQLRAQDEPYSARLVLRLPISGRDVLLDAEGTPIAGGGCVVLMRDVGKEEDERRRLSRFASFVAHELRNPLAVAKARIELTARGLGQSASGPPAHAARALESVDSAIDILERLELYSRAESGRIEALKESFDLRAAVDAAIEQARARGFERDVSVVVEDNCLVIGDRHLAELAITNLITNADRYSVEGGPVHIEAAGRDPVALRIIDAGPGVSDQVAEQLFRDRVAGGRGLGLGLYLVHRTMVAQGGSVQLEERSPRAVFALRWRRAAASRASEA